MGLIDDQERDTQGGDDVHRSEKAEVTVGKVRSGGAGNGGGWQHFPVVLNAF